MRAAFAAYAESHEPASIRRCWSTWNTICTFLFANEEIPMNPMPLIGRPKIAKTLPKAIDGDTVAQLLAVIAAGYLAIHLRKRRQERDEEHAFAEAGAGPDEA